MWRKIKMLGLLVVAIFSILLLWLWPMPSFQRGLSDFITGLLHIVPFVPSFENLVIVIASLLVLLWLIASIKIVGPAEMAVKVIFGMPISFCESGFRFVPYLPGLKCYLKRYPKKMYNFAYTEHEVISMAGIWPEKEGVSYGAQILLVNSVAYLNFPRELEAEIDTDTKTHPLVKILRAGVPIDDEELKDWTEEVVVAALRVAFGKMTWRQAVEDMEAINKQVATVFKKADGALIRAGFRPKGIGIVIEEIKLPPALKDALPQPDQARLALDAARNVAQTKAIQTVGTVIEMMAKSRSKTPDEIRELVEQDPEAQKQFLGLAKDLVKRQMAIDGKSFLDIRVQGAQGIERALLNLFALLKRIPDAASSAPAAPTATPKGKNERPPKAKRLEDMTDKEANEYLDEVLEEEEEEEEGEEGK